MHEQFLSFIFVVAADDDDVAAADVDVAVFEYD